MRADMIRPCSRCHQMKECTFAERIQSFCCGDCWTEDLTIHSTRLLEGKAGRREETSPWGEKVLREWEDG